MAQFNPFGINPYQPVQSIVLPQLCAAADTIQTELNTLVGQLGGTTYYVDSSIGNDSNLGTSPSTAWQTIGHVNAFPFAPGDAVLFNSTQSFSGTIQLSTAGTSAAPITIGSYGLGLRATINAGNSGGVLVNQSGITIRDLNLVGTAVTNSNSGINAFNNNAANQPWTGLTIINCIISTFGECGIAIGASGGSSGSGFVDILITGCEVSGCCFNNTNPGHGHKGIILYGVYGLNVNNPGCVNALITNCYVHDNLGGSGITNASGTGIECDECRAVRITNCLVVNNGANSATASGPAGILIFDSIDISVENCTVISQGSASGDGNGIDIDAGCQNCTIRDCYAKDCVGAGLMLYQFNDPTNILTHNNNQIINSISENCGSNTLQGVFIANDGGSSAMTNIRFLGNRVYFETSSASAVNIAGANVNGITGLFWGNQIICTGNANALRSTGNPSSLTIDSNQYYAGGGGGIGVSWNGTFYNSIQKWAIAVTKEQNRWFAGGMFFAATKAGAPVAADIPQFGWALIRDETNSTTKIYYNNAGTLMSVALT